MGDAMAKLLLNTNVVIDFLNEREPFYEKTRLLMICGRVGEFELWLASSQITDLIYVLSDGGKQGQVEEVVKHLRELRTFVNVFAVSDREIDLTLAAAWKNPEDYLLVEVALALNADAVITRNQKDFPEGLVRVLDCDEFFEWMSEDFSLNYEEVAW